MKQRGFATRLLAVLLAFCFFTASFSGIITSYAADSSVDDEYAGMTAEEKQALIEQKLKEVNEKLDSLGEQSKETEEYINTLDEKIRYLKNQLSMSEEEINTSQQKIKDLKQQYKDNEEQIAQMEIDIAELSQQTEKLQQEFAENLELYNQRLRAMYVSGNTSVLAMLLTSPDISTLLTRFEMVKRVSASDRQLLESVKTEADELTTARDDMQKKQTALTQNQKTLVQTEENLTASISQLETQQVSYEEKQTAYESQKNESDALLKKLQDETQTYSEYRNQDQAELEAVNAEIAKAAEEFRKKMEAQTTTKKPTTTKKQATQTTTSADTQNGTTQPSTETTTEATTESTTQASNTLKMTYPVPSQTKITCDYGSAGYAGHTGVDFSCPSGSAVVAAESGYVFYTKQLTTSYGYHIVIMHDKTDSAGNYVYTLYAHNSQILVTDGQYVNKGQTIAYSGSTGNSTGPHCHFEVRTPTAAYANCVDPKIYLP